MQEWVSVKKDLPGRQERVYAKDDKGRTFIAAYFGPTVGWVNLQMKSPAFVTHWARGM